MVRILQKTLLRASAACLLLILYAAEASAHVKWFSTFVVADSPRSLDYLQLPDFKLLVVLSLLILALGCLLEESPLGPRVMNAIDRVTVWLRTDIDRIVRTVCALFFIALWSMGGIILTPELKTTSQLVPWLQFAIAITLIWRVTSPLAALGIVVLFGLAVWNYGVFHLADYPIFLGIAAYLALTGLQRDFFGVRPLDIMRWATGITLMWASVEKWAYPQWSFPLIAEHPSLTLGFESGFFMLAAGVIEFVLAFALLWTPLVRRFAAIILAGMFVGACFEFGKLDVIGHTGIIVVLLAIVGDDARMEVRRKHLLFAPVGYAVALAGFLGLYYGMHAALFAAPRSDAAAVVQPVADAATVPAGVAKPLERARRFSFASRIIQREPSTSSSDGFHTGR